MTTREATSDARDVPPGEGRARAVASRVEEYVQFLKRAVLDLFFFLRFLPFALYIVLAILAFWLWFLGLVLGVLRFGLRAVMIVLLWLSGGVAPPPGHSGRGVRATVERDLQHLWNSRLVMYEDVARPIARHVVAARHAGRTFLHWSVGRQAFALLLITIFVGIPGLYIVPRPHYVIITDDNAVHHEGGGELRYLIHARDLHSNEALEYENEVAWWLGKLDPQGLKSYLHNGRAYRLWVVGIRWWYKPMLFPNIISAREVDMTGTPLSQPSLPPGAAPVAPETPVQVP
ncbi:MAG: hypothetical protein ACLGHP_06860 [Vicinamibacteria bacterium]